MTWIRSIWHLMRADLLDRTRRYSYLITLGFVLYAAYMFVPSNNSTYTTLSIAGHRGIYNSAWIGTMVAMMTNAFLSLAGFYLVKNSVKRDVTTRVGQILAATRVSTLTYVLGKAMSNLMVLGSMLGLVALSAISMQLVRGEDVQIHLWQIVAPFLLVSFPMMAVIAAMAILFESIALLRGGLGNIIFFILWILALSPVGSEGIDIFGFKDSISSMQLAAAKAYPLEKVEKDTINLGFTIHDSAERYRLTTFVWDGIAWTLPIFLRRLIWIAFAAGLIIVSGLLFKRFDESTSGMSLPARRKFFSRNIGKGKISPVRSDEALGGVISTAIRSSLAVISGVAGRSFYGRLVNAEFRLMMKGVSRWWYIVAMIFIVLSLTLPLDAVRQFILPLSWVWPLLLWSSLGSREIAYRTEEVVFSCAHAIRRQFFSMWFAGVLVALLTGGGAGLRFAIEGAWPMLLAWSVGALFIPTFALVMGVWTTNGKMFEILYMLLWYIGPINKLPALDFLGSTPLALEGGKTWILLLLTLALLAIAMAGRRRQVSRY